jgi:hypothetical protein
MNQAGFLRPIAARRTGTYDKDGRAIWRLLEDLCFYSAKRGCWVITPAGFHTNYASVPRVPFAYLWYGDICWEEPAGHDYPYTTHTLQIVPVDKWVDYSMGWFDPLEVPCTKDEADDLFLEALLSNPRIPTGSAHTMHKAVSWFGASSWNAPASIPQPPAIAALAQQASVTR